MHDGPPGFEAANDAAPFFPDLSAMSMEEFADYEPSPERLGFYALHTDEGLKAFLYDLYWIGYSGLFIGANHAWKLLIAPRAYRCTLMGQQSGAGGAGKQALVNTLRKFIDEALETFEDYPPLRSIEDMEAWHNQCMAMNVAQDEEVQRIVAKYAAILNGKAAPQLHSCGMLRGPWKANNQASAGSEDPVGGAPP